MIALAKPVDHRRRAVTWAAFLPMLPTIARYARIAFRGHHAERRDDLIQETIANAAVAFQRLVQLDKPQLAYPTVLARYGVAQVLDGRRVGNKLNVRDVLSEYAQRRKRFQVDRLDRLDHETGQWQEVLVEDHRATPAELAASRIDFAAWLRTLPRQQRKVATTLATGETTSATAKKFGVSPGRISQLRRVLLESWWSFQGEALVPSSKPAGDH